MDLQLLYLINVLMAHPLLDGLMLGLSTVGLALLPIAGIALLSTKTGRQLGRTLFVAMAAGLVAALIFQLLSLRPRPEAARYLLAAPKFPSFPSGHAAIAFGFAGVVGLSEQKRRWSVAAFLLAGGIAFSRVYLGHHYPSDILAGAVLGLAVGAACHGLFNQRGVHLQARWRWLLWPQIAVAMIVTQMAYLDLLPFHLLRWPLADKFFHFLLFGAITFWLNLWIGGRSIQIFGRSVPVAILLPFSIALLEEIGQAFSPIRSADIFDLTSDLIGMLFFWFLSNRLLEDMLALEKETGA